MKNRIYLDYAATTPVLPEVLDEMLPFLTDQFGNPSAAYSTGREARKAVEKARRQIAEAVGAEPAEICFTSGGSESDNMAILGIARAAVRPGHIITTAVEHHAVLNPCRWLEKKGWQVTYIPVDGKGRADPEDVRKAIRPDTALITMMTANNEIGTIQPIAETGRIAIEAGIPFHTDAVQAAGSVDLSAKEMRADLVSISAHKIYGPKGTGALVIRRGTRIANLIFGGAQERGLRAGTENTAGIVGFGKAMEIAVKDREENARKNRKLRDMMIREVLAGIPDAALNGDPENRLDNNCHFSFAGIDGEALLLRLDLAGIAVSGGSACTSGSPEPSHVLQAIGVDGKKAGSIRLTVGHGTTEEDVLHTVRAMRDIVDDLRRMRL